MTQDEINKVHDLTLQVTDLVGRLKERCPQQAQDIKNNRENINIIFSKIRAVEQGLRTILTEMGQSLQREIHEIKVGQARARWISNLANVILAAAAVKYFVG